MSEMLDFAVRDVRLLDRLGVEFSRVPPVVKTPIFDLPEREAVSHRGFAHFLAALVGFNLVYHLHLRETWTRRAVRLEVRDPRFFALELRIRRLEEANDRRVLWRLSDIENRIKSIAQGAHRDNEHVLASTALLKRLHRIVRDSGLQCFPPPQLDQDPEEGSLEFAWFDRQNRASLSVSVFNDFSSGSALRRVRLLHLSDGDVVETTDPDDSELEAALRQFIGG